MTSDIEWSEAICTQGVMASQLVQLSSENDTNRTGSVKGFKQYHDHVCSGLP